MVICTQKRKIIYFTSINMSSAHAISLTYLVSQLVCPSLPSMVSRVDRLGARTWPVHYWERREGGRGSRNIGISRGPDWRLQSRPQVHGAAEPGLAGFHLCYASYLVVLLVAVSLVQSCYLCCLSLTCYHGTAGPCQSHTTLLCSIMFGEP